MGIVFFFSLRCIEFTQPLTVSRHYKHGLPLKLTPDLVMVRYDVPFEDKNKKDILFGVRGLYGVPISIEVIIGEVILSGFRGFPQKENVKKLVEDVFILGSRSNQNEFEVNKRIFKTLKNNIQVCFVLFLFLSLVISILKKLFAP